MPEKRVVMKKGKRVITRKGKFVLNLADKIYSQIRPYCKRAEIVGSIRRKIQDPIDIDMVVIPRSEKNKQEIEKILSKKGKLVRHGQKVISYIIKGVKTEVYFTDSESWGAAVFAYTGPSGYQIGIRVFAKKMGLKFNQYGLFKGKKKIAGKTEKEIYKALGKQYKKPEKRE